MVYEGLSDKRWKKQQEEMYHREYEERKLTEMYREEVERMKEEEESDIEWEVNPFIRKSRIIEQKGGVFTLGMRYALVHCIAQDAMMGAGIARKFREKYPDMQRYIRSKRPKIGEIVVYEAEMYEREYQDRKMAAWAEYEVERMKEEEEEESDIEWEENPFIRKSIS